MDAEGDRSPGRLEHGAVGGVRLFGRKRPGQRRPRRGEITGTRRAVSTSRPVPRPVASLTEQPVSVAAIAADAVVLEPSLAKVDELIHIGRRMRSIALQSAGGGMALSAIGMIAAAMGYLPPVAGAVTQELIDLAAVLNAVRVSLPSKDLTDF